MILVINTGSSSIKYKLYQKDQQLSEIKSGTFSKLSSIKDFTLTVKKLVDNLLLYQDNIKFVAYRIVHNGGKIKDGSRASQSVIDCIKKYDYLAPLHNSKAALVMECLKEIFTKSIHLCYFDTTYFENLPEIEKNYAISSKFSRKFEIKKYGFHGISHQYAYNCAKAKYDEKVITIHLGAGCSISAIKNGKPQATSMGMTPLSGLIMQTRSGDLDPGLMLYLTDKLGIKGTANLITNNSGLAGLTQTNGEMLDVLYLAGERIEDKSYTPSKNLKRGKLNYQDAKLALDLYCDAVIKYIGAYSAVMGGLDRIIFTGKIGFGSTVIRQKILSRIKHMKVKKINIVEPNEELAIALKVAKI